MISSVLSTKGVSRSRSSMVFSRTGRKKFLWTLGITVLGQKVVVLISVDSIQDRHGRSPSTLQWAEKLFPLILWRVINFSHSNPCMILSFQKGLLDKRVKRILRKIGVTSSILFDDYYSFGKIRCNFLPTPLKTFIYV